MAKSSVYHLCPDDGKICLEVGAWSVDIKMKSLRAYVHATHRARRNLATSHGKPAVLLDPYCSTGRVAVRNSARFENSGSVAAAEQAVESGEPFTHIYINDLDEVAIGVAAERLARVSPESIVVTRTGTAEDCMAEWSMLPEVNRGYSFAFLDPFSLGAMPFNVIQSAARIRKIDVLAHISTMDIMRNIEQHDRARQAEIFDAFAPNWRERVSTEQSKSSFRSDYLRYWIDCIRRSAGLSVQGEVLEVSNDQRRNIYALLLASRHPLAKRIWDSVRLGVQETRPLPF